MVQSLVDFIFKMGNAVQRTIRLEGRATSAKCGANTRNIGADVSSPTLAVGDTYGAITKLAAVGSYTSPGTNALSVSGNVTMPGYMFCAGLVSAAGSEIKFS